MCVSVFTGCLSTVCSRRNTKSHPIDCRNCERRPAVTLHARRYELRQLHAAHCVCTLTRINATGRVRTIRTASLRKHNTTTTPPVAPAACHSSRAYISQEQQVSANVAIRTRFRARRTRTDCVIRRSPVSTVSYKKLSRSVGVIILIKF